MGYKRHYNRKITRDALHRHELRSERVRRDRVSQARLKAPKMSDTMGGDESRGMISSVYRMSVWD